MSEFIFEFYQTTEILKNAETSDVFHGCLVKISQMIEQLKRANQPISTARKVSFKDKTFSFSVNPGADILENLDIEFSNCTFLDYIHCNRFASMALQDCKINQLVMAQDTTQLHVMGGNIQELLTAWDRKATHCLFDGVKIEKLTIKSQMEEVFFKNCTFDIEISCNIPSHAERVMRNLYFTDCRFYCAPDFMGCDFSKSVSFYRCTFVGELEALGKYYRDLKHKMSNNQDELSATFFGGLEIKSKHGDLKFGIEYCLSHGYRFLSDYGLDQFRPVRLLGWLAVVSFLVWGVVLAWSGDFAKGDMAREQMGPFMQIVYLTFVSVLGPLRLLGNFNLLKFDTFCAQILVWAFTTVASLLWFFIILAVRRRFKVG